MAEAPKDQELLVKGGRYQVAAETYPEWYETKGVALVQWREYDNGWRGEMCDGDYLWYRPTHFITVADLLAPCTEHPQPVTSELLEAATKLVPIYPTEAMWGGLARDIVFWMRVHPNDHSGQSLHAFLRNIRRHDLPSWFEAEIGDNTSVPPKGTIAAVIYRAMIEEAPVASSTEGGSSEAATTKMTEAQIKYLVDAFEQLVADPEVATWLSSIDRNLFLPKKRSAP